jgi:hypothetical protein
MNVDQHEFRMIGKTKHAQRLTNHLGFVIDAACPVTRVGAAARQMSAGVGGAVGALVGSAMANRGRSATSDVQIGAAGWLALGDGWFWIVKGDLFLGRPKGEPLAVVAYAEVANVELFTGKLATRADIDLADGRYIAFESKRRGANKMNAAVLEEFRTRCGW